MTQEKPYDIAARRLLKAHADVKAAEYDLEKLLKGVTDANLHPEISPTHAVGNEFPNGYDPETNA